MADAMYDTDDSDSDADAASVPTAKCSKLFEQQAGDELRVHIVDAPCLSDSPVLSKDTGKAADRSSKDAETGVQERLSKELVADVQVQLQCADGDVVSGAARVAAVWEIDEDATIGQTIDDSLHVDDTWEEHFDPNTSRNFYFNPRTGESRWELPASLSRGAALSANDHHCITYAPTINQQPIEDCREEYKSELCSQDACKNVDLALVGSTICGEAESTSASQEHVNASGRHDVLDTSFDAAYATDMSMLTTADDQQPSSSTIIVGNLLPPEPRGSESRMQGMRTCNRSASTGAGSRRGEARTTTERSSGRAGSQHGLPSRERLARPTASSLQHSAQARPAGKPARRHETLPVARSNSRGMATTSERQSTSSRLKPMLASTFPVDQHHDRMARAPGRFQSTRQSSLALTEWSLLPDAVLLQAIVLVGPREVCAAVAVCGSWAETVTASEAWLWSVVGCVGLAPEIFTLLGCWAAAAGVALRHALQLWLCRAHLWGGTVWAAARRNPVKTIACSDLPGDGPPVCCAAWPGGDEPGIAVGFSGGTLSFGRLTASKAPDRGLQGKTITGFESGATVRAAHGHQLISAIRPLSPEGKYAVTSGLDGLLRIWDCANAAEASQIVTPHGRGINGLVLNAHSNALCCGDDGLAFMYDLGTPLRAGADPMRRFQGHDACAYCAVWTSESTCATGGFDRRTLIWDCRVPAHPVTTLPARQHVYALAPLAGGAGDVGIEGPRALAVALADGTIAQWDLRHIGTAKQPLREMRGHLGAVEALTVLPGDILVSASADGTLRLWDRAGNAAWLWSGRGPMTGAATVLEDTLLAVGLGLAPTVLTLDYVEAAHCVPEAMERLHLPTLQPWKRGPAGIVPPEGIGRHSDLLSQRRLRRGSVRGAEEQNVAPIARGSFDRSLKTKPIPLGATGAAHRAFLIGARH